MGFSAQTSREANAQHYRLPFRRLYTKLLRSAKGREVTLTYKEFVDFTKIDSCEYCGDKIEWVPHGKRSIRYNLDRKNNSLGYSKENCVVCCKSCNFLKGSRDEVEFLNLVYKIYSNILD